MRPLALCLLGSVLVACGFHADGTIADAGPDAAGPGDWKLVTSGGAYHACGLRLDGSLWCWGDNSLGQIGIGSLDSEITTPRRVGDAIWLTVATGDNHTCGIRADNNTLWCWGDDTSGQLGSAVVASSPVPVPVAGSWESVSLGATHSCGITTDHHLACWGTNAYGEAGDALPASYVPRMILVADTWRSVTAGYYQTCAIRDDRTTWCFGYSPNGLGGQPAIAAQPPIQLDGTWTEVETTYLHTCGIRDDGRLRCWGANTAGQLGDGTTTGRSLPRTVGADRTDWLHVAVGYGHSCATRTDGTLWCWGDDTVGQIGVSDSHAAVNAIPTQVAMDAGFERVGLGFAFSCAISLDHHLRCTGSNMRGQLGDGRGGSRLAPVRIEGTWTRVSTGVNSTCATGPDGTRCWGNNLHGELGNDRNQPEDVPQLIGSGPRASIMTGNEHACEIRGEGDVWCWGNNAETQLGNSAFGLVRSTPTRLVGVSAIALPSRARDHTCAIPTPPQTGLVCWGRNTTFQLGTAEPTPHPTFVTVLPAATYGVVGVGFGTTCAITTPGMNLQCWGDDTYGQIGNGAAAASPVPFDLGTPWSALAVGTYHVCGVTEGALYCWGYNSDKQVSGTALDTTVPVLVDASKWVAVSAGTVHTCGIHTDGSLWCWGANLRGHLGDGTFLPRATPTQVGTDTDWATISTGSRHTCGLKTDGSLWCWGANEYGQVGDGDAWRSTWDAVR